MKSNLLRILSKIQIDASSGCWLWTGRLNDTGYGRFSLNKRIERAHRAMWMIKKGPIPNGMNVLHRCDVRCCVNPDHLFVGSQKDNIRDCISKRRFWSQPITIKTVQPKNGKSRKGNKLTAAQAAQIRALLQKGEMPGRLSEIFKVSISTIAYIRKGTRWRFA